MYPYSVVFFGYNIVTYIKQQCFYLVTYFCRHYLNRKFIFCLWRNDATFETADLQNRDRAHILLLYVWTCALCHNTKNYITKTEIVFYLIFLKIMWREMKQPQHLIQSSTLCAGLQRVQWCSTVFSFARSLMWWTRVFRMVNPCFIM